MEDFELGGYPVVADALHGYMRDDTLVLDRMYRVVARPVEYDLAAAAGGRDRRRAHHRRSLRARARRAHGRGGRVLRARRSAPPPARPEGFDTGAARSDRRRPRRPRAGQGLPGEGPQQRARDRRACSACSTRACRARLAARRGYAVARLPAARSGPLGFFARRRRQGQGARQPAGSRSRSCSRRRARASPSAARAHAAAARLQRRGDKLAKGEIDSSAEPVPRRVSQDRLRPQRRRRQVARQGRRPAPRPGRLQGGARRHPGPAADERLQLAGRRRAARSRASRRQSQPLRAAARPQAVRLPKPPRSPAARVRRRLRGATQRRTRGTARRDDARSGGARGAGERRLRRTPSGVPCFRSSWHSSSSAARTSTASPTKSSKQTLRKNRDTLIQRHGAKRVKFSVYVKDGKAALKANPIKDSAAARARATCGPACGDPCNGQLGLPSKPPHAMTNPASTRSSSSARAPPGSPRPSTPPAPT